MQSLLHVLQLQRARQQHLVLTLDALGSHRHRHRRSRSRNRSRSQPWSPLSTKHLIKVYVLHRSAEQ